MKKISVIIVLCFFCENIHLLNAQNSNATKNVVKKKSSITQDLNKLELEKINAIVVGANTIDDSLSKIDITKDNSTKKIDTINSIKKITRVDTLKKNTKIDIVKIIVSKKNITTDQKLDTLIKKTILLDSTKKIDTTTKSYSLDTILHPTSKKIIKNESVIIDTIKVKNYAVKEKLSFQDSILNTSYIKQAGFADSIRNANKEWLDSTLTNLPKNKPVVINNDDRIEIFVSGGGFYAGVNAKIFDRLTIYYTGLVHREFKTKLQGEQVEEKMLSKDELKKLAQYIIDMGFFSFDNLYDCKEKDYDCNTRMKFKPEPVPLTISVAVGLRRKKIYISFFAPKIESNYVAYPTALENIVEAIYGVLIKSK